MNADRILDRDKLHIVYYVDISGIENKDVQEYLSEFANQFKSDDSVASFFLPVKGHHTPMVEFHWPPYNPSKNSAYMSNLETDND